jgi:hypothetical protein
MYWCYQPLVLGMRIDEPEDLERATAANELEARS